MKAAIAEISNEGVVFLSFIYREIFLGYIYTYTYVDSNLTQILGHASGRLAELHTVDRYVLYCTQVGYSTIHTYIHRLDNSPILKLNHF